MFTGIIEALGSIAASETQGGDQRLLIVSSDLDLSDVQIGDSICVSGVCLTATSLSTSTSVPGFWADVSHETLARTVLGELSVNAAVNLEKSLTPSSRLGGHLVSGHVDGVGEVAEFRQDARSWRLTVNAPAALARYIAEKGSICIDGVSLTVNGVDGACFDVNIVPHTLQVTTIGDYRPGRQVNLEVDQIARYLERLLLGERAAQPGQAPTSTSAISEQLLRDSGFIKPASASITGTSTSR